MRSLAIGATGMLAQQTNVDVISNNIANMNTTAYTKRRAEFNDLLYQNIIRPGAFFHRIAFFYPIFGLTTAFRGYLEGRGDLMYSSAAGLVSLAVRIIASYAMAPHFGNMTIAYAEMVSWVWLLGMYLFRLAAKKDDAL